ncbi:ABC transporter ATP-binding protein [Halarchaeum nitratireducens]|uniref:Peptide ABC transporter ATP-binding protein n=1 Tax=Halarchaeum nitratireducens TaxID=489913 RepID=A0A830GGC8_9EURY|nr:ABC transporter ATP-binding protein [Halarchaeum nitratireducens]GGN24436.1 peptide ABC transporter ATP-binding protein [Halarchaeum nitratireducens]
MSDPLLTVEDLAVTFPDPDGSDTRAVDGVSLSVEAGEIHGLVGESGSGKSVTARTVLRLLDDADVSASRLAYRGEDLLAKSEREMRAVRGDEIGMVFQDALSALNPVMTVGEQIAEVVRHHGDVDESTSLLSELRRKYVTGTSKSTASWRRAVELLETVGIPDPEQRASEYPHQLSGGQRQRVMIAQALAGDPSLIIADEPTTALDVTVEAGILTELRELCADFNVAILLITHDLGVVAQTCDHVTVMYSGSVMEHGPTDDIFEAPAHPYTEGLLRSIPEGAKRGDELATIPGSAPDPRDRPAGCPFRDRCPEATEACTDSLPEHALSAEHHTYCHHRPHEDGGRDDVRTSPQPER